jgi:anti-sigma factor RsiW
MNDSDKLLHYVDGNLSTQDARALEAKLEQDPALKLELDMLKRIQTQIGNRPVTRSPGLWDDIEAQINADLPDTIWPHLVWASKRLIPLMAAAAVILMAALGNTDSDAALESTLNDFLATQTDLVLSEISATDFVPYTDSTDQ